MFLFKTNIITIYALGKVNTKASLISKLALLSITILKASISRITKERK